MVMLMSKEKEGGRLHNSLPSHWPARSYTPQNIVLSWVLHESTAGSDLIDQYAGEDGS